jgi:bacteriorhodopsin
MAGVASAAIDALAAAKHHHPVMPPATIHDHVSHFGENVLWITFIVFAITFVVFAVKTSQIKTSERANAYTSLFIVGIAAMSYYAMATGLGVTYRPVKHHLHHFRQFFFARYIDWIFTTPLLLLDLVLVSGLDLGSTLWIVFSDVAMILTGLFGSYASGRAQWGWFIAGCAFLVVVMVGLLKNGAQRAYSKSDDLGKVYTTLTSSLLVLWWIYPIVWLFTEGKTKLSSDKEVLCFAILDILAKVVWSTIIFMQHEKIALTTTILDEPLLGGGLGATDDDAI